MEYKAKHRFADMSARKIRPFADLVRGRDLDEALELLRYLPNRSARLLEQVLKSARGNRAKAARLLDTTERILGYKIKNYAIDCSRIERELGWTPSVDFEQGLARTVDWYLANEWWWGPLRERYAGERLGKA